MVCNLRESDSLKEGWTPSSSVRLRPGSYPAHSSRSLSHFAFCSPVPAGLVCLFQLEGAFKLSSFLPQMTTRVQSMQEARASSGLDPLRPRPRLPPAPWLGLLWLHVLQEMRRSLCRGGERNLTNARNKVTGLESSALSTRAPLVAVRASQHALPPRHMTTPNPSPVSKQSSRGGTTGQRGSEEP